MKKKKQNKLIYLLPVLALVGYFAGQFIKKTMQEKEISAIEAEVFPIVRDNISDDMKLVIEPDYVVMNDQKITLFLKQDTNAASSPAATQSRGFIRSYLTSKVEGWKNSSKYQDKEIEILFVDELTP